MKKIFVICFLAFSWSVSLCQDITIEKALPKVLAFVIDSVIQKQVKSKYPILVSDEATNDGFPICKDYAFSLKAIFSIEEMNYIDRELQTTGILNLKKEQFTSSNIEVINVLNDIILKGKLEGPNTAVKDSINQAKGEYQYWCAFSYPIFLRNNRFCVISYGISRFKSVALLLENCESKWRIVNENCVFYFSKK